MTSHDVKRNIWRNTLSNYICVAVRLLTGVVLFRLLYNGLSTEEFGFWAILWAVFGYGILLDFGFGFTAQKRVAELSVHRDWERLSRVLSTIFFSYVGLAACFILVAWFGSGVILNLFKFEPQNREPFRQALTLFLCGLGLAFPMGLFPEILRGQQRISLSNYIFCAAMLVQFILTATAIYLGCSLKAFIAIALTCTIVPDLVCGLFAMRQMPEVSIRPKYFSRKMVSETMSFSVYAYLITLSGIMIMRTDQLVLGSALGVAAVALYQAGAKVAEMFTGLSHQLPETFSPAAAHLHAQGDRKMLQRLLVDGTRFSVIIATPLYLICAFGMNILLSLLTAEATPHPHTYLAAQILLLWGYTLVLTQSVSKRVFMMCGHEKRLTVLALGEAALNLLVSVALVLWFRNIVCAALGSLVASSIFGWCYLWPWAAREAQLSGIKLARTVLTPTWVACLPLTLLMLFGHMVPQFGLAQNLATFIVGSILGAIISGVGLWHIALKPIERAQALAGLGKLLQGAGQPSAPPARRQPAASNEARYLDAASLENCPSERKV